MSERKTETKTRVFSRKKNSGLTSPLIYSEFYFLGFSSKGEEWIHMPKKKQKQI